MTRHMTSTDVIAKTTCVHPWLITKTLACHTTCHRTSASVTVGVTTVSHPPASSPPPFSPQSLSCIVFPTVPSPHPPPPPPPPPPNPPTWHPPPRPGYKSKKITSKWWATTNHWRLQITGVKSEDESSAHYLAPLAASGIRNLLYEAARLGDFLAHRLVPSTCSQQQTHARSLLKEKK